MQVLRPYLRQPLEAVEINWDDPITEDLRIAVLPHTHHNLAFGSDRLVLSGALAYSAVGDGQDNHGGLTISGGSLAFPAPANSGSREALLYDSQVMTALVVAHQSAPQNNNQAFYRGNGSSATTWGVGLHGGSNNGPFAQMGGTTLGPSSTIFSTTIPRCVVMTGDGSTAKVYGDGRQYYSSAYTPSTPQYGSTRQVFLGNAGGTGAAQNIRPLVGLYWGRPLTPDQVAYISDNPYRVFRGRRVWVAVGGVVAIEGTLAATLANATLSATGTLSGKGAVATTLANATLAATGTLPVKGAVAATLANATLSATGALPVKGSLTKTLDNATLASTGALPLKGTLASTLADATLSATGALQTQGSGALTATLADATLSSTGAVRIAGQAGVALANATLAATGVSTIKGAASATLANATLSSAGVLPLKGASAITLQDATLSATGNLVAQGTGSLSVTLASASVSAQGVLSVRGAAAVQLQSATLLAAGALQPIPGGQLAVQLADASLAAVGKTAIAGAAQILLAPATLEAGGGLGLTGILSVTLADLILFATGRDPSVAPPVYGSLVGTQSASHPDRVPALQQRSRPVVAQSTTRPRNLQTTRR